MPPFSLFLSHPDFYDLSVLTFDPGFLQDLFIDGIFGFRFFLGILFGVLLGVVLCVLLGILLCIRLGCQFLFLDNIRLCIRNNSGKTVLARTASEISIDKNLFFSFSLPEYE